MMTNEQRKDVAEFIVKMLEQRSPLREKDILTKVYLSLNEIVPESVFITLKARNKIQFVDKKWQVKV